jgi:hypothetical protein
LLEDIGLGMNRFWELISTKMSELRSSCLRHAF